MFPVSTTASKTIANTKWMSKSASKVTVLCRALANSHIPSFIHDFHSNIVLQIDFVVVVKCVLNWTYACVYTPIHSWRLLKNIMFWLWLHFDCFSSRQKVWIRNKYGFAISGICKNRKKWHFHHIKFVNTFLLKHHITYLNNFWKHQVGVSFFNTRFFDILVSLKFFSL